ncbi:sigma-70 family RNA polymerase sigma factor [Amycolatopsis sp. NEAU-NG30]|uniref:Sigma-70 family RNA polymerase sigma factor n=1 Tax=Amycolatopsis melonis TaxID=3156488 RepID=A0ABV0LSZ7_9PSEU
MTEVAPAVAGTADGPSDAALIEAVRGGDIAAYGQLYDRHRVAARRVAAAIAADDAERDDLIAEGFTRVLRILRSGEGPDSDFRPYLLTTIRNTMISWRRRDSAVSLVAEVPEVVPDGASDEPVGARMHATVAVDAFASLPERWRTVLWRTEIDGESPARIAADLGMTPNGVAALAYRAREGLRQAYLDQHVPAARRRNCRIVSGQLARWVRDGISDHKAGRISAHLDRCADCRELAAGLRQLNEELPAGIIPLILGVPVVSQWLSATGTITSSGVAAGTSASALSWATAAKVAAAGAALVTTVTIGASTSSVPPPSSSPGAEGSTGQPVRTQPSPRAAGVPGGTAQPTTAPATEGVPTTGDLTSPPATSGAGTTGEEQPGQTTAAANGKPAEAGNPNKPDNAANPEKGKPSTQAGKRQNESKTKEPKPEKTKNPHG